MKNNIQKNVCNYAGTVEEELLEIQKVQKTVNSYLTMVTNTCSEFLSLFCC